MRFFFENSSLAMRSLARTNRLVNALSLTGLLGLTLGGPAAGAQTAHFGGLQSTFSTGSWLTSNGGIAIDAAQDVFVADSGYRRVVEYTSAGTVVMLPLGGLNGPKPAYLALDKVQNLYVAETTPGQVLKLTYSNGAYSAPQVIAAGFTQPSGIAVDGSGNVYVADRATGMVTSLHPGSSSYSQRVVAYAGTFNAPVQMAIDANNQLYVADSGNNRVAVLSTEGVVRASIGPFTNPSGVAVDANGNVAVTSSAGLTYAQPLKSGGYTYATTLIASNFTAPLGLAFEKNGIILVNDVGAQALVGQTPPQLAKTVSFTTSAPWEPGSVPAPASAPATMVFVFDANVTLNRTGNPVVATLTSGPVSAGVTNVWQSVIATTTCLQNQAFTKGQSCTASVVFQPLTPNFGFYTGTVGLEDSSYSALASVPVNGTLAQYISSGGGGCSVKKSGVHPNLQC